MRLVCSLATCAALTWVLAAAMHASAAPQPSAHIVKIDAVTPLRSTVFIDSPAMHRVVQVQVLHPTGDAPRPNYYLLDGAQAPDTHSDWLARTDIASFFADKNVNVVLPIGGHGSYYSNWEHPDPALGIENWETFLTEELPPIVDRQLHGNGHNVIAGLSMGGTAAAILTTRHPQLYRGVGMFSGCPNTVTPDAQMVIEGSILREGGTPNDMWGPADLDPDWGQHDPMIQAESFRGKAVYFGVGTGIPGPRDTLEPTYPNYLALAMPLEAADLICGNLFQARLATLGIPMRFALHAIGTHAWPYWQDDVHESWPMFAAALG